MRHVAALVALVLLLPVASAQDPDPTDLVSRACGVVAGVDPDVRDAIPACPRDEPAAPQQAAPTERNEAPAAPADPAQDPAGAGQALAREATEAVEGSAQDPASAPDRLAAFVASVLQAVRDLLSVPLAAVDAGLAGLDTLEDALRWGFGGMREGLVAAGTGVADGARGAFDAAASLVAEGATRLAALFGGAAGPEAPARLDVAADVPRVESVDGWVDGFLKDVVG